MESLLTPDLGLTIWTVVTFLVLLVVLGKFAWKPMLAALDAREEGIRRAVSDAEAARKAAEDLRTENQNEWARAREKADALLKETRLDADKLRADLLKKAETDARQLVEQAKREIDEERAKLSRDLRQEVAGLSVRVAEKLLRHSMNPKEQETLVQGFLKDLDKEKVN